MDNIFYESHDNFFKVITKRKLNELHQMRLH